MPRLCYFGCNTREIPVHRFPSSTKCYEQLISWVTLVGGKLEKSSDYDYYRNKIICDKHFTDADKTHGNRLNRLAVPSLYLSGLTVLHGFPNPEKDRERFNNWLLAIGGDILGLKNDHIHKYGKVCHNHFEVKYHCRNNKISNVAVPTLNLPGLPRTLPGQPQPPCIFDECWSVKEVEVKETVISEEYNCLKEHNYYRIPGLDDETESTNQILFVDMSGL